LSIDLVRQFSRHKSIGTLLVYRDEHENKQGEIAGWVAGPDLAEREPILNRLTQHGTPRGRCGDTRRPRGGVTVRSLHWLRWEPETRLRAHQAA
jgi:hypothetical protein